MFTCLLAVASALCASFLLSKLGSPNCYWLRSDGQSGTHYVDRISCGGNPDAFRDPGRLDFQFNVCLNLRLNATICNRLGGGGGSDLVSLRSSIMGRGLAVRQATLLGGLVLAPLTLLLTFVLMAAEKTERGQYPVTPKHHNLRVLPAITNAVETISHQLAQFKRTNSSQQPLGLYGSHHSNPTTKSQLQLKHPRRATSIHNQEPTSEQSHDYQITETLVSLIHTERRARTFAIRMQMTLSLRVLALMTSSAVYGTVFDVEWREVVFKDCEGLGRALDDIKPMAFILLLFELLQWLLLALPLLLARVCS